MEREGMVRGKVCITTGNSSTGREGGREGGGEGGREGGREGGKVRQ